MSHIIDVLGVLEASNAYEAGKQAYHAGKSEDDNPHIIGKTKLGSHKFGSEEGHEWLSGFTAAKPSRVPSRKEIDAAASVDVRNFGAKYKRRRR